MATCHGKFSKIRRLLENDVQLLPIKTYRIWNEVPTVLMIVIVFMAVLKPFSKKIHENSVKQSPVCEVGLTFLANKHNNYSTACLRSLQ